jgi:hypothetical protein
MVTGVMHTNYLFTMFAIATSFGKFFFTFIFKQFHIMPNITLNPF